MMLWTRQIIHVLGHDSWVVRRLRSVHDSVLEMTYGRRGMEQSVNGVQLRFLPRYRWYFTSTYDTPVANYFRERIRPGAICLSVGANLGIYPLQFANWSAPNGVVYAFEPNPQTAAALRKHVALNRLTDRVHVMEQAIADRSGEATFYQSEVNGMSRLGEENPLLAGQTTAITVGVDSLDHFCDTQGIRPNVLMIDIEGFEIQALAGAQGLFTGSNPPVTVLEMHPNAWTVAGTDRASLEQLLSKYRLRAVALSGQSDPFAEYGHVALEPATR
jgi:FkbM family methyltransferase